MKVLCICLILCIGINILPTEGFGGLARGGSVRGLNSMKSGQKKNADSRFPLDSKQSSNGDEYKTSKGNGRSYLSAWGIISLIMLIIVGSVAVYYVSIFYPLVCAKRGKYDVMEMTAL